ncbi:BZ3500_MvSof-1268-A1-R1_Chr6-3g08925 [Microbotryum saponariae]|uniref:BZ3500_MvSof-1268-A1-R1_Chr6-3g08925 protein n=1 Tax=Microbotryum saponariae TaxID=289078 RepID=A0A2X0NP26_9BASI|nr:BZ3500_MvSof-1268-A1-R1_Chr6-3g08925 [Microbotryum saponariae]SDA07527.1 BZ3501_MvSof-1269-A2-R1_Chr6-2g08629 [Microbotryum saponariae]
MNITVINNAAHLNQCTGAGTVSIIDFHATWCGPCHAIAPVFQALAQQYAGRIQFFKVDVDQAQDVASQFAVSVMPTFVVLNGNKKVAEMKGADPNGLKQLVAKHALAPGASTSAGGSASSSSSSAAPTEKGLEGFTVVNSGIDMAQVHCLNESADHTIRHLLRGEGDKYLESDADEQLLLQIPVRPRLGSCPQALRIRAIRFKTISSKLPQAPKKIRLFVNAGSTLTFDDAESLEPAQEIELSEKQAKGEEAVQLRFVRFQNVTLLSVFVASNQGGEEVTRLDGLELIGASIDGTDMSALSKGDDHDH